MRSTENKFAKFDLDENGILYVEYKEASILNVEAVKAVISDRLAFQNGISCVAIADVSKMKYATAEAREYMSKNGEEGINAYAVVKSDSRVQNVILNLFLMLSRPKVPVKVFLRTEDAERWALKQTKEINEVKQAS